MEKSKKSKKKLIGIIAGCAMAFVLTVVVSVAVTLAYFGDKGSDSTTITMGQKLEFTAGEDGKKVTASTTLVEGKVLPGANGDITVSGTIGQTDTTAYLRVKVVTAGDGASSIVLGETFTCTDGTFVKNGSGDTEYYYLAVTDSTTNMQVLNANADGGKTISFTIPYSVDNKLTNEVAGQTITVTVTMEIIQSANIATVSTVANVAAAWNAEGVKVD